MTLATKKIEDVETDKNNPLLIKIRDLEQKVKALSDENFNIKTQRLLYEKEFEIDSKTGVYNVHYAKDTLTKYVDMARRGNQRTRNPQREAVSIAFLSIDHYLTDVENCKQTIALTKLQELTGFIRKYVKRVCRVGDQFAKASFAEHEFLLILPETDKKGTQIVLKKLFQSLQRSYDDAISVSYGIANYALDIVETGITDDSKRIASALIDHARKERRTNGVFSGNFKRKSNYVK